MSVNYSVVVLSGESRIALNERYLCAQIWSSNSKLEYDLGGNEFEDLTANNITAKFYYSDLSFYLKALNINVIFFFFQIIYYQSQIHYQFQQEKILKFFIKINMIEFFENS